MKMVFTLVLGLALLFPAGAQAGECLSRNEIRKMIEQSFYSLYRWQNYWYGIIMILIWGHVLGVTDA